LLVTFLLSLVVAVQVEVREEAVVAVQVGRMTYEM
jgi:hypothetical protein